jgi:hypothetical protein
MLNKIFNNKPAYSEIGYTEREYIQNRYDTLDKVRILVNFDVYGKNSIEINNIELKSVQFFHSFNDIRKRMGKPAIIICNKFGAINHQILYYKFLKENIKRKHLLHLLDNKLFCIEVEYCEIDNIKWKHIKPDVTNSMVMLNHDISDIDLIKSINNDLIIFNERPPYTTKFLSGNSNFKEAINKQYSKELEKKSKSINKKYINIFKSF